MAAALFALSALLTHSCADAFIHRHTELPVEQKHISNPRSIDQASLLSGCLYEGRWHSSGSVVVSKEKCLQCVCVRSALSCRRKACAPLMDPPPKRCHIRHRRESCCPELVCPDGVVNMEQTKKTRFERDDVELATPNSVGLACVEGGTVYAAGSAMSSNVACEQCFCLKGARKCVRPNCLPPPPHCVPRPTPGACCPQRYYCEDDIEVVEGNTFDCELDGKRIQEGERVFSGRDCTACFCLNGKIQCQDMGCAPILHGCSPVLRPGDCCAHQYKCERNPLYRGNIYNHHPVNYNSLKSNAHEENRALHVQKWAKASGTGAEEMLSDLSKNAPIDSATTNDLEYTVKVKRKTDEAGNDKSNNDTKPTTTQKSFTLDDQEDVTEENTEQPEETVKIVVNGTINCTAELSSTSLPLSIPMNNSETHQGNILPRVPIINGIEAQGYEPNDIITDRSVLGDFDEDDTFTINVTSSLNSNTKTKVRPEIVNVGKKPIPVHVKEIVNGSKKTDDYDYDYTEPTLPPSLPNLKIIPFVAADAVVDDDEMPKNQQFPILESEDKYPVYYHVHSKETINNRDDNFNPTQYPIFENHMNEEETVTKSSAGSKVDNPAYHLFSPPVETEGGFIPKGPGIADSYYPAYAPSTPSGVAVPHLTTSMQLDVPKADCITEDGRHVPEGGNITLDCNECICEWGRLRCAPTLCRAPKGCHFKEPDPDSVNQCCGDLVCKKENKTASASHESAKVDKTNIEIAVKNKTRDTVLHSHSQFDNTTLQGHLIYIKNNTKKESQDNTVDNLNKALPARTTPQYEITTVAMNLNESAPNTTTEIPEEIPVKTLNNHKINDTSSDYEDDEDMGFSFGSVLKLLLSENYDTTTASPHKKVAPAKAPPKVVPSTTTTTRRPTSIVNPFVPLPPLHSPPKNEPATINRIDHLVLGEATAIKRTTVKPTEKPNVDIFTPGARPPSVSGSAGSKSQIIGTGILKLAGCNIYGRIYRLGRIISELSTPCLECWCTEIGVECRRLDC